VTRALVTGDVCSDDRRAAADQPDAILGNGLPVFRAGPSTARTMTALLCLSAGVRAERSDQNGVAHFLEHLVFRGSSTYRSHRIIHATAESFGGVLNAGTSHDLVSFHITVRPPNAHQALDLLTDIVGRPRFPPDEVEREREVVLQEIHRSQNNSPYAARELADLAAFGDHPLGRPVLGRSNRVRSLSREDVTVFRDEAWSASSGGLFLAGNLGELSESAIAEFGERLPAGGSSHSGTDPPVFRPGVETRESASAQSHVAMMYEARVDVADRRSRASLLVYATLLGGSMASRLFEDLRARAGMCYAASASAQCFADVAIVRIAICVDPARCIEACHRVTTIVETLRGSGPTEAEVRRTCAYVASRRVISFATCLSVARQAAQQTLVYRDSMDPELSVADIDAVTLDDVRHVARNLSAGAAVGCVGPHAPNAFLASATDRA
jgi:predicted Zn-dependent peptidase